MASKNLLIWQLEDWPKFTATSSAVEAALLQARKWQGEVIGRAAAVGLAQSGSVLHEVMTQEVIATAAIEGEKLDPASVRSSILRQLGHLPDTDAAPRSRHVDGLVDVIQDATLGFEQPLTEDRLLRWQSALFPGGTSGIRRIAVGRYRDHSDLMQIVSGQPGKEVIHYTAPPSPTSGLKASTPLKTATVASAEPSWTWLWRRIWVKRHGSTACPAS
jgi:Fic family protein